MKIFLLLIVLNYSIFASGDVNINRNSTKTSEKQEVESNKKDDNLKKLISEEVEKQIKANKKNLEEVTLKKASGQIDQNTEKNLTLVYNIDQIYKNANDFYNSAFIHLLWIISFIGLVLGFFKWKENQKIKDIEKDLQESKNNLDKKILIAETTYIKNLENKKSELFLEMNKKIIENTEITTNNIATNEFIRDIYDFDKEKEEGIKAAILDKIEKILETNYKNLDWKLKLEFFKRKIMYYEEKKDRETVSQILEEIFKKYGYNEETYRIRGDYYFNTKQFLHAKENYLRMLDSSKEKLYIFLRLGEIEKNLNKLESARNYYELALKEEPNNAYYLSLIGKVEEDLNNSEKAKEYYKKSIQNSLNSSYYWSLLGELEEKLENLKEAKECYKKAILQSPCNSYYLVLFGRVEERLENLKEAKEYYEKAIYNAPNNSFYLRLIGGIEEKLGNFKEAREYYEKAIYQTPNDSYYLSLLGGIEEKLDNFKGAKEYYKKAILQESDNPYYWSLLGGIEEKADNFKEAKECYEKAVIQGSDNPYYWSSLGRMEEKADNLEKARECYEKAIYQVPNDSYYLSLLGGVEEKADNLEKAKEYYEKASNNSPSNSYYLRLLGEIEEKLGNYEKAKEYYEKALEKEPNDIFYLSLLGKIEEKLNNIGKAIKIYKKIAIISSNNKISNCQKILELINLTKANIENEINSFFELETEREKGVNLLLKLMIKYQTEKIPEENLLKKVLEEFKDNKEVLIELSNYFLDKNTEIACESLKKYLEIEKENIDVNIFNNLGVLEERKGNEVEAVKLYIKAIEKDPNFILGYYNKGHLYMQLKNYEDALINLKKARKINKRNNKFDKKLYEKTLVLLGEIYSIRKNYLDLVLISEELYNLNKECDISEKSEIDYNNILEEVRKEINNESENNLNIKFLKVVEKNIEKIITLK